MGEQVKEGGGQPYDRKYLAQLADVISEWESAHVETAQEILPLLAGDHGLTLVRVRDGRVQQFQQFGKDYDTAISLLLSWEEDLNKGDAETLLLSGVGDPPNQ